MTKIYPRDCQCADCGKMITFPETYLTDLKRGLKTGVICLQCYESSGDAAVGARLMAQAFAAYKAGVL